MAVFTAIATAIAGVLGGGAIAAFAANFLVSTAMGLALNALAPKTSTSANAVANSTSSSSRGYSISGESGAAVDHQIIYGRSRVGGVRLYDASTGGTNQFLHRIIGFAGHEIQSYDEIYLNDEVVTLDGSGNVISPARYNGFVRLRPFYGTTTQTADPDLAAETAGLAEGRWTVNHRLLGVAYIYARFQYDPDVFPNGIPIISATIKGRKVYDPRTTTTVWSDNPALCIRDYLTAGFGLSQTSAQVDDASITIAANICEEVVDGEDRYTCNGSFVTGFTPSQVISDLLTSMGGLLWYSQGQWRMKAAKYVTPTITFSESDLRSGVNLSTRHSRRNNFNTVKGKFKGPESTWQEADYPTVTDPVFVSADNNLVNTLDFPLPYTTSSKRAQRIANIALRRNREQLTFSASFGLRALSVQVGDFVYINNTRFGWVNKPFEVSAWGFGLTETLDLQVQMTLREISSAVFTDEPAQIFENNNTTLPNPFYTDPIGISLASQVRVISENITDVILANITATVTATNIERVEVQFKRSDETAWSVAGVGDLGIYEIIAVDSTVTYDVRVRSYSFLGIKGDWVTYLGFQPSGLLAPPANVGNFRANLNGGSINLEWGAVPDLDLSHYKIRHSLEEAGATFGNSTTSVEKVSRPATSITVPTRPGTYSIRAYDKLGNASPAYSQVIVPVTALETFTNNLVSTQSPTFSGTKTGCSLTGSELRITTTTSPPSIATYVFTSHIDTGAVRRVRSRVDVNVIRYDAGAGLWDAIPSLFDEIPGPWDDWTGGTQFADTDVVTYISFTNQDPAGTPTWSEYQPFKAGDFYGRAFRFKVELLSDTSGVSPSISGLTARVQYN